MDLEDGALFAGGVSSTASNVYADMLEVTHPPLTLLMELSALVHHFPCHDTFCILYAGSFAQNK